VLADPPPTEAEVCQVFEEILAANARGEDPPIIACYGFDVADAFAALQRVRDAAPDPRLAGGHLLSRGGTTADASAVFAGLSRFVHGRRCLGSGGFGCCPCSMRSMSGCDSRSWPQGDGPKWRHLCGGGVSL